MVVHLRDLLHGKIVSSGAQYIVVQKDSRKFRIEFTTFKIKELKKQV
jgi:hypothetical protein